MRRDGSILHLPTSQFAYPSAGNKFTIRLRTGRNSYERVTLCYGDRAASEMPLRTTDITMRKIARTTQYDWYESVFDNPYERICYYFKLEDDSGEVYYYADRFSRGKADYCVGSRLIDARSEYYQYPCIMREEIPVVPSWFQKAIVYHIFPDSFASGKRELVKTPFRCNDGMRCFNKLGGTLRGIENNLDYIQELGCDTLYLNPIFRAVSYHKYDIIDYYHIDPAMGTDRDFRDLVEKVHSRGMHIILDGVFNHTGIDFFAFRDIREKGKKSRYFDWYYTVDLPLRTQDGNPSYACFAYVSEMPKLNTSNPEVQEYFAHLGAYYVGEMGVDGWRLDVANEVAKDFLRAFGREVRKANGNAVLIGEVWENASAFLSPGLLDSVMDYDFRRVLRDYFAFGTMSAEEFADQITDLRMRYPEPYFRSQLHFLDSHDVARFLSLASGNIARLKQAIAFQMIFPGVPSLFYGDEKLLFGVEEEEYRRAMDWQSPGLTDFYREAIHLHKLLGGKNASWKTVRSSNRQLVLEVGDGVTAVFNNGKTPLGLPEGQSCLLSSNVRDGKVLPDGFVICG